jgi:hypothetical protein
MRRFFDIVNGNALSLSLTLVLRLAFVLAVAHLKTLARNGMFGKRGEIPPLPRNCERARCSGSREA